MQSVLSEEDVMKVANAVETNTPLRVYLSQFDVDVPALCATVRALQAELKRVNACHWCSAEMERVPVDGGDELGCTNEACPSFGIGIWCYADHLRARLKEVEGERDDLRQRLRAAMEIPLVISNSRKENK